jgi:hypothetical protein
MLPDRKRGPDVQLLRALYFNRTGILFLLMAIASILMIIVSSRTKGTAGQFWLGLGAATIATTGYSFVQVLLTTSQFNTFLSTAIEDEIQQAMARGTTEALETFRTLQAKYLPVSTYPALDVTNPRFNLDLNLALTGSARYTFRGMSARYAVARLALLPRPPRNVILIIADPSKPSAVDFRARHDSVDASDAAFDRAKLDILDGICMTFAGAYLNRRRCDHIEFVLTPMPHVDRVEICDSAIFIQRFSEDEEGRTRFPSSVRFRRDSLIYQMFDRDCGSILVSPYAQHLELSGDLSEEAFCAKLETMGVPMSSDRWAEMKRRSNDFQVRVSRELLPGHDAA